MELVESRPISIDKVLILCYNVHILGLQECMVLGENRSSGCWEGLSAVTFFYKMCRVYMYLFLKDSLSCYFYVATAVVGPHRVRYSVDILFFNFWSFGNVMF